MHVAAVDALRVNCRQLCIYCAPHGRQGRDICRYRENWPHAFAGRHAADAGAEISGWAAQLQHAEQHVRAALPHLYELALRGTAVGTGLNAPPGMRWQWRRNWPI